MPTMLVKIGMPGWENSKLNQLIPLTLVNYLYRCMN